MFPEQIKELPSSHYQIQFSTFERIPNKSLAEITVLNTT